MRCVVCNKEIEKSSFHNAVLCSTSCFKEHYWRERVAEAIKPGDTQHVVCNHQMFYIESEDSTSSFRGYGGAHWLVEFFDGRKIHTTNLWHNGTIPEKFWEQCPDTATLTNVYPWKEEYNREMSEL